MALDPEELKRRRQQRQAQRQANQRKLRLRLCLAAVAVIACAVVILLVSRGSAGTEPSASTHETQQATQAPGAVTTIRIAAVGDVNITDRVVQSGTSVQDYNEMLLDVSHLLADPELTLMNLEGVLYGPPYGSSRSAPEALLQALKKTGVDAVQIANSYSIHKGVSGLASTVSSLGAMGLEPLGAYESNEAFARSKGYTIINVCGIRIAIVAFTKGMDGMALPAGSEQCVNLLYTDYSSTYQKVDTEGINAVLTAAQKEKPDLTVAMLHWGSEFNDNISASQNEICQLMLDGGVDAIIGTHSHYVQKMELDRQTGKFVAYSLGDFLGDAARAGSEYSVILHLTVEKNNETGDTAITDYSYTPIFTVNEEGKPLRVLRLGSAIEAYEAGQVNRVSETTYEAMKYALGRVEARVAGK